MIPANPFATRAWYKFSRNWTSVAGLCIFLVILLAALLAPWAAPYPEHAGMAIDIVNSGLPPSGTNLFGTDLVGRDILTRVIFGFRTSLLVAVVVLGLAVPVGVMVGIVAAYFPGIVESVLMRITDVFLAMPPLVLAMAIMGVLPPSLFFGMIAVSVMWWPWYSRLAYNLTRSVRSEGYVVAAEVIGAPLRHTVFREILPNIMPPILTKMSLDVGFVIITAASLSFLGLGAQAPTPDLGSMVAEGAAYMPDRWWLTVFPGLAILLLIVSVNLVSDGIRDTLDAD